MCDMETPKQVQNIGFEIIMPGLVNRVEISGFIKFISV